MIYLDNAATTKIKPEVLDAMLPYLTDEYGNPSSQYDLGYRAKEAIENAREIVANTLNVKPSEIFFTSGATEGINYLLREKIFGKISTGELEHHAILNNPIISDNIKVKVDKKKTYNYDLKSLEDLPQDTMTLVLQYANNEIGSIHPAEEIGKFCHDNDIVFVTDATQAYGHIPIDCQKDQIDCLVASGHKFGAPKGVGFIYLRAGFNNLLDPIQFGGNQEMSFRAGTENVMGIVGLGKAAEIAHNNMKEITRKINERRNQLYGWITNNITGAKINGTADWRKRLPGHLNFRFTHVKGEELVSYLNEWGICVSTGSACDSESGLPSYILKAIGLSDEEANSSIRFTIGEDITKKDIEYVCETLKNGIEALRY